MASRIVVRDVAAGYGAVRVLHGVSIEVREGETVALLGTNGNGKSTLIKCIMGMVTPEAGEIFLEQDGARIDLAAGGEGAGLALKAMGGAPPFTWLVGGVPIVTGEPRRQAAWPEPARGFARLSVIDGKGSVATAKIRLD